MSQQPIGVFDSGVGGLSILQAIQQHLPNENLIYFADSAYAPYGKLDQETLHQRCLHIAEFFIERNAKALVIACNTATAMMADWLRAEFDLPIIALEPAIKPACELTKTKTIGVFATENTLKSERYLSLLDKYAQGIEVLESPCYGFVEQVEKGDIDSAETIELIEKNLKPMLDKNADILVLGCTHYPFLARSIAKVADQAPLTILDTADAVATQLSKVLNDNNLLNAAKLGTAQYFTSSENCSASKVFSKLLTQNVEVKTAY